MPTNLLSQEEIWKNFEKTGILDGWEGGEVIIDNNAGVIKLIRKVDEKEEETALNNYKKFAGKRLIFRNCKNLKKIDADCLGLKGISFEGDCSQLEHLSAYNNQLEELNLTGFENLKLLRANDNQLNNILLDGCTKLENLKVRNNQLKFLELDDNKELTYLDCSNNNIGGMGLLEVTHLEKLETLHCYYNNLLSLDCSNLTNLKDLNCHNNNLLGKRMHTLNINGCESLERLDTAENGLERLDLFDFPNLKVVSAKENLLSVVTIEEMPNLEFFDASRQYARAFINGGQMITAVPTEILIKDDNNAPNLKKLFYSEGAKFFKYSDYEDENSYKEIEKKNILKVFPKLKKFECSTGETGDFERYLDKLNKKKRARRAKKKKNNENGTTGHDSAYASGDEKAEPPPVITDPSQLNDKNDYPDLVEDFANEPEITIAGEDLYGIMIIDGYKGRKINVGDNYLSYLVVRNCPNLTTLRYAHNALLHDAWYDPKEFNNPKLTIIDNHNWDGRIIWDQASRTKFEKGELTGKERFNERLRGKKKDKKNEELRKKLYQTILEMLVEAEKYADQGDWARAEQNLNEVKQTILKSHLHLSREQTDEIMPRIKKLDERLLKLQEINNPQFNKLIISFGLISFFLLGTTLYYLNKWFKRQILLIQSWNTFYQRFKKILLDFPQGGNKKGNKS